MASAFPYGGHEKLRLAIKFGGDYDVYPRYDRWPAAARGLGLDSDQLTERVRELACAASDAISATAAEPSDRALSSDG